MKIEALMTADVGYCRAEDTLEVPAAIMWEGDCGCVPVVDDERHVIGIVTDRDMSMAAFLHGKPLHDLAVGRVMSKSVITCLPTASVEHAEQLMQLAQVRRLPIVDDHERLVGILSLNDIALAAERDRKAQDPALRLDIVALTLSAVCHRRVSVPPPISAESVE
jgi:CBS domain-containing protein